MTRQYAVPQLASAILAAFVLCSPLAQTQQSDYDKYVEQGYTAYDANRKAVANEADRDSAEKAKYAGAANAGAATGLNYKKLPPLPANRNPLLGKWQLLSSTMGTQHRGGDPNSIFAISAALESTVFTMHCDRAIDFRAAVIADAAGNAIDQVQYRSVPNRNGTRVAVLGTGARRLQEFDMQGRDRMSRGRDCQYTRVGSANVAAVRGGASAATASSTPKRAALGGGIAKSGVNFGASIENVQQSLAGRTVDLMPARHNAGWYRLVANGEFSDIDPRIAQLTYEFDAPQGAAAKLIGIVLTYRLNDAAQGAVYGERVSTLSKRYPLAQKSPTTMEATVAGTVVSVINDTTFGQVHEIYRKTGATP